MREMKDSGVEWIGEIPKKWNIVPLTKKLNSIIDYRGKTPNKTSNGVFLVTAKNIKNGIIDYDISKEYVDESEYDEIMHRGKPEIGDVLFTTEAPLGSVANVDNTNVALAQRIIKFSINNEGSNYFLKYWILNEGFQQFLFSLSTGSTATGIKASKLCLLPIVFPSLSEQQKIATYLDTQCSKVDTLIANQQSQIEKLKSYKQSLITEVVTKGLDKNVPMKDSGVEWIGEIPETFSMMRMKNLGYCRNGLTYSPENLCDENGTLVLRSSNVQNGKLCFDDNVYVDCEIKKDLMVKKGDIIICSRNGSKALIGKSAIVEEDIKASFGAFMMIFRSEHNSKYIYYILNSNVFTYYLGTYLTATINQLTGSNFNGMMIPFCPDEEEQLRIIRYLDDNCKKIEKLISLKQQKIEKLQQYKKSLIYEYVTGKKEVK